MNEELQMLVFRGYRTGEDIAFNGVEQHLQLGGVILALLDLDRPFFDDLATISSNMKSSSNAYHSQTKIYEETDVERDKRYLRSLNDQVQALLAKYPSEQKSLIAHLLVFIPCYDAYMHYYDQSERLLPWSFEQEKIQKIMQNPGNIPADVAKEVEEEYTEASKYRADIHSKSYGWNAWLQLLAHNNQNIIWGTAANVIFNETDGYAIRFETCLHEVRKLHRELRYAIVEGDQKTMADLQSHLPGARLMGNQTNAPVFKTEIKSKRKYGYVYGSVTMLQLVMAEFNLLNQIDRQFVKCELCDKYFVPYRTGAKYCRNPNPAYNGKICSSVAAQKKYRTTHNMETVEGKAYLRKYKAYSKWANQNIEFVKGSVPSLYGEAESDNVIMKEISCLTEEITSIHDKWRINAEKALERISQREITAEEFENAIALPSVSERSPKVAELRRQLRIMAGNAE